MPLRCLRFKSEFLAFLFEKSASLQGKCIQLANDLPTVAERHIDFRSNRRTLLLQEGPHLIEALHIRDFALRVEL